jgi:hypothetical protein
VLVGIERAYVDELGPAALLPSRKHPIMVGMLAAMLSLSAFTRSVGSRSPGPLRSAPLSVACSSSCEGRACARTTRSACAKNLRCAGRTMGTTCAPAPRRPTPSARSGALT